MGNIITNFFFNKKGTICFEMDDWFKWYKQPQLFHDAVLEYLKNEGKTVQTLSIKKQLTSNEISTLLIDGKKYRLTIKNKIPYVQSACLIPLE